MAVDAVKARHAEHGHDPIVEPERRLDLRLAARSDLGGTLRPLVIQFDEAIADDLNTPVALTVLEDLLSLKKMPTDEMLKAVASMDAVLGLGLLDLSRADLRLRPEDAQIAETEIEAALERRKAARAEKDFATSDAIRDELAGQGRRGNGRRPAGLGMEAGMIRKLAFVALPLAAACSAARAGG